MLHQRHMLIGCGMEYNLRLVLREHLTQPRGILDIADGEYHGYVRKIGLEFLLDAVKREFVQLEQHQAARSEFCNLAA